jgi:hypothetical protein
MMKKKGKALIEEHVERQHLKQRRLKRCSNGLRWMLTNSNEPNELIWKTCSPCNRLCCDRTYYKIFYEFGKNWNMEESKDKCVVKNNNWLSIYSWTTWDFQGRSSRCYKCNLWRGKNHFEKDCNSTCLCWIWTMECSLHEGKCYARYVIFCKFFTKKSG